MPLSDAGGPPSNERALGLVDMAAETETERVSDEARAMRGRRVRAARSMSEEKGGRGRKGKRDSESGRSTTARWGRGARASQHYSSLSATSQLRERFNKSLYKYCGM